MSLSVGGVRVLPPEHRLRARHDYRSTVRRGVRVGRPLLVVHVDLASDGSPAPARVGFVVDRAVGGAVTRNAVRRRLRHLLGDRVDRLPAGSQVVIRARPKAAGAPTAALAVDLDAALDLALLRVSGGRAASSTGAPS